MYNIIKKYCENENTNGLFLIDMPTGFGKTYSVLKYISDACRDENNKKRKYFFITPLKKNLPVNELKKFFDETLKTQGFSEKVLVIKSNMDMVMENYPKIVKLIPDDIKETQQYKNFNSKLSFLQKYSHNFEMREIYKEWEDNFRLHIEPAFRKMLTRKLSSEFGKNKKAKLFAVKTDKKWKWLGGLYPTVFTDDYQIYFMSMDKFITENSTIVEPSYLFVNSKLLDDAVIFIDEFDSSKETILNNIIQNGLNGKIDFIEMFISIYSAININELPSKYTNHSDKRKNSGKSLHQIIDDTKKLAEEIYCKYSMQFNYRTVENIDNSGKSFMFQDYRFHSIIDGNKNYICTSADKDEKLNYIDFRHRKPKKKDINIHSLLRDVKGFISWFQGTVRILAVNYKQLKDEQEEYFTLEQAIKTVISEFHLKDNYAEYLASQIMLNQYKQKNNGVSDADFDLSIHENGFRYYCFENDSAHDMQTKIMIQSFNNTPEKKLIRFCEKAKVIGISATATLPTVIGNFDLEYIQNKIGNRYSAISEEDFSRLKNDFEKSQSGYGKIKIHSELIGASGYSVRTWENIFNDKDIAEEIYNMLDINTFELRNSSYNREKYARIAMAFRNFLEHDDIRSFLCFLTKHPANDNILNKDMLVKIFEYMKKDFPDVDYEFLKGDGYDTKKDDIIRRLADGKKIFVISTYQTIGAGQNLQYSIPENLKGKLIHSNNSESRNEKDFDAVYLDKPTHLIVNMTDDWKEESFIKYMFQMEFLHDAHEISGYDKWKHIKDAFNCYYGLSKYINDNFDHIESIRLYAARIIIQAIGRICRTNQKNKNIYVFADEKISDIINPAVIEERIFNPEFISLCDKIKEVHKSYSVPDKLANKADVISEKASRKVDNLLNNIWTEKTMYFWKILRDFSLKYPTMSSQEEDPYMIRCNYFVQLPTADKMLYYSQSDDFRKINISFTQKKDYSILNEENTRLDKLMKWDILKEYFIEKGYATEFRPNEYIMSPAVWNNIYKGALGEEVGKSWFYEVLGISLEELNNPEIFELFDFKVPNKQIFVDFKNWSENYDMDLQQTLDKIYSKAKKCNCECAIIANVLATESHKMEVYKENGIKILVVPSLLQYNDIITVDEDAKDYIRRWLDEYTD